MDLLLDLADALVASSSHDGKPDRPDFDLPESLTPYAAEPEPPLLELRDSEDSNKKKNKGWYAKQNIPAGTLLMIAKPIAMVMDWQDDVNDDNVAAAGAGGSSKARTSGRGKVDRMESEDDDGDEEDEDDDDDEGEEIAPKVDETEGWLNEALYLEVLERLKEEPSLWLNCLSQLFPRTQQDIASLPAAWVVADDALFVEVETALNQLQQLPDIGQHGVQEISKRLPLIIRYNVLSVETCPELLSYPGPKGHASLSGVALYYLPSFFNHSCRPNCSRWAVGDVMGFVANQDIAANQEVCISYIEHDVLCEPAERRNRMLNMDFLVTDNNKGGDGQQQMAATPVPPDDDDDDGPSMPVVDTEVQNELMSMDPFGRLQAIEELLQQAVATKSPGGVGEASTAADERMEEDTVVGWVQCDIHNLRILKAITLDGLGQTDEALRLWEESIAFVESHMPPNDESLVPLRVQAALCSHRKGDIECAKRHAELALRTHHLVFGGGVSLFRRRFRHDLELRLRPPEATGASAASGAVPPVPSSADSPVVNFLWPLEG